MHSHPTFPHSVAEEVEPLSIALIDDDPAVRCAVGRLLSAMDFSVSAFGSAEEFLDSEQSERFDCILLDIHLTGISGLELHSHLMAAGSRIPVIFISNDADAARAAGRTMDGTEALCKPLDAEVLLGAIARTQLPNSRQ